MAIESYKDSQRRYPVLRFLGSVFLIGGTLGFAVGGFFLVNGFLNLGQGKYDVSPALPGTGIPIPGEAFGSSGSGSEGKTYMIYGAIVLVAGLQCMAYGEVIKLMVHAEENSRAAAQMLSRIADKLEPPAFRAR